MKNSIRNRKYKPQSELKTTSFLYNFSSMGIIVEILIGAVLGIAICCGFIFSFIILRGNLFISLGIFLIILILALFLVFLFKYAFMIVMLKVKEIEILEKILHKP